MTSLSSSTNGKQISLAMALVLGLTQIALAQPAASATNAAQAANGVAKNVAVNVSGELATNVVFLAWQGNRDVQSCGLCHYAPGNLFAARDTDFCRLTELKEWLAKDKHAIARQRVEPVAAQDTEATLANITASLQRHSPSRIQVPKHWIGPSNYLSYAMCQQLGYDIQTEAGYAQFRDNCLTCHGGFPRSTQNQNMPGNEQAVQAFSRQSTNQPGISCTACHQQGDSHQWIDMHSGIDAKDKWRNMPPVTKALNGMRHLASASAQAQLCTSCHIGDIEQGKFITHAMYAAGHPILPSVELSTLVEALPRHWRNPRELAGSFKSEPQRTAYFQSAYFADQSKVDAKRPLDQLNWQIDSVITGSLVAQQTALRLIEQAAAPGSAHWGDYALYDCAACHHELRLPSQRQALRAPGAPGRPRLGEWPQALPRAIALASGTADSMNRQYQQLLLAVSERPFGDRAKVAQSAGQLNSTISSLRTSASDALSSEQVPIRLLQALVACPDELLIDYHAARQVNWAIRAIDAELDTLGRPLSPAVRKSIAQLGMAGAATSVETISKQLPSGQSRTIVPDFQAAELKRQMEYDSQAFIKQLRSIGRRPVE